MSDTPNFEGMTCPIPITNYNTVQLAHGGGGTLTHQLIEKFFVQQYGNEYLNQGHDGAVLNVGNSRIAFSTDSYVVRPIFFPGGNIGELAINGTVNDLAMCGAKPLYISVGFILEEGLPMEELWQIVQSMNRAAKTAGVQIVTGDTKVVDKGKGDKIYINTSGIGVIQPGVSINPANARPGDKIIVNGFIADHGIAVMSAREGLQFETSIVSDTAPLNSLVESILQVSPNIHVMRDPTRGGLASTLKEISEKCNHEILLYEEHIPIREEVKAACELLGFDPLYVANEGKMLVFVSPEDANLVLRTMQEHPSGKDAQIIGEVTEKQSSNVILKTTIGSMRIVDMLSGEQLPRIC